MYANEFQIKLKKSTDTSFEKKEGTFTDCEEKVLYALQNIAMEYCVL